MEWRPDRRPDRRPGRVPCGVTPGLLIVIALWVGLVSGGCSPPAPEPEIGPTAGNARGLVPAALADDEGLRVVATTGIIGDVVSQIGGDRIDLAVLLPVDADPHSFVPTPRDLAVLADAHIVFVNGLGLEAGLDSILSTASTPAAVVSVNDQVEPLFLKEGDHDEAGQEDHAADDHDHDHGSADPHTWFRVAAVRQWTETISQSLAVLDGRNGDFYRANAAAYQEELRRLEEDLQRMVDRVPPQRRKLVTDHDSLGYLAADFGFEVVGTLVPSLSTIASPSAADLALIQEQLRREEVGAIFVGTTVSVNLAQQMAADSGVQVVTIYTGALSAPQGPAATYLEMMRYNVSAIVEALAE